MAQEPKTTLVSRLCKRETLIFVFSLAFVVGCQQEAFKDRFLLILYYLGALGAAYSLIRRGALGYAAAIVAVAGATIFVNSYFASTPDDWQPWLDGVRDLVALALLLFATYGVLAELYRYQREAKERELRQLAEKQMIQMRAQALRSTSHEVRTPLTTITALCETLSDGLTGELNEMQREFVRDIDDAAQHLLSLVNDILDYAKFEAGMIKLMPEPVALAELVEQCVSMVEPKAEAAGVAISAHVAPELKEIVADPLRLKQILINLLSNAVKYNERGGSVTVRLRPDGQHVLISVRDTGRGIGEEHMPHLFDPYYQAAIADQSIGTGLGLAIIKHLTELHGGAVHVESVVGTGSVFTVRLPRTEPGAAGKPLSVPQQENARSGSGDRALAASW
jgi:signal transduction histidine kinase